MVMPLRSSLVLYNCLQFYKLINHAERASNPIIYLTRFVRNSGCIIGGCCFSRQSDEDNLLPKNKHEVTNIHEITNSLPHSFISQRVRNLFTMKRSYDSHCERSSLRDAVNSDTIIETCNKKQKIEDIGNDNAQDCSNLTPVNKNLGN